MSVSIEVELSPVFQTARLPSGLAVDLEEERATVRGLLDALSEEWGEKMDPLPFEKGGNCILSGLMVMVNDRMFTGTALNPQVGPLHSRDKVSLLYSISGG